MVGQANGEATMSTLLMAAVLAAVGADKADATAPHVEGKWLIVYAEENSKRINSWEQHVATIKDNTLTYERDGKDVAIQLKFGPNQTLKASVAKDEKSGGEGVYIAGQDYLSLSLTSGSLSGEKEGGEKPAATTGEGKSSGSFILILRRQR
jgi:hypothetical protein